MSALCRLTIILVAIFLSFQLASQPTAEPLTIGVTFEIKSEILDETRIINVVLPDDYNENDTIPYPVIYLPDGGVDEDLIHIAGIVRYYTQPWIARFPKSILVRIENINRRRDFTYTVENLDFLEKEGFAKESFPKYGESERYIAFIEKELQPYIEKYFKGTGKTTIIGESLAGLLATEILVRRSNLFDEYIIISPSLWWDDQKLTRDVEKLAVEAIASDVKVYIGVPNRDEDAKMYDAAEALYIALKCKSTLSVDFNYMPDELHSTVMHQAVYNAFNILYPTKKHVR